ncbi:hypothetical protein [Streptomyces sp. NBC_00316]|uniref:hypothetical protein n=1 Tax=Streptomyces sp. NBC_00316 TaxID=2975710 RepID=UPI002E2907B5|nr:hypothetical protein [Streptomyces sp. NBC_00316]
MTSNMAYQIRRMVWSGPHRSYDGMPPPATSAAKHQCLVEALGWFEAAVCVGEALLPEDFTGLLPRDDGPNSWFYRAVGGLANTLWRLGRFNAAEHTLLTLLHLNPLDNYGARDLLPLVRSGRPWTTDLVDQW